VAPATLLWIGGVAAVVVVLRREAPEYAEVADTADTGPDEPEHLDPDPVDDPASDRALDDLAPDRALDEPAAEPVAPVSDADDTDAGEGAPECGAPDVDQAAGPAPQDGADDGEGAPECGAPDVDQAAGPAPQDGADEPERARPARTGLFGRRRRSVRNQEPAAPPRPRTVADLVADLVAERARAAEARTAREPDDA
jgi:hypothetical protein